MFEDKVLKHKRAEGYYRRNAALGNVDGAWKNFVESNKVPDPSSMKLAEYIPMHERDNFNTPDLEQTPNSVLKPGETLEDFDVTFRRPNAEGGVQQLVRNTVDGSRPGYGGNKGIKTALEEILETQTTFDSKSQLIDLIEEKVGYRPGKKIILPNKYPILKKVTYKSVLPVTSEEQLIETFGKEDLAKIRKEGVSEKLIRGRRSGKIRFANLTKVEKAKKTEDNRQKNKNLSEETALDRKEKAMVRRQSVKGYSFYKVNKAENLLWNDLLRTAKNKNGYFTFKGEAPVSGKYYNKAATENFVLVDKKGNEFKYSTLSDDITKHSGYKFDDVLRPYKQKEFLATEGLTKELNKLAGYELGSPKSVFHTQHIEGIDKNPWKVHLTFGDQNIKEAAFRKSFNADWKAADTYSKKKTAVNRYYKSLGPDIVAQIGKKSKGEIKTLIQLLDKTGIKLTNTQRAGATALEAKIKELGGKEKVTRILTNGSGTVPERTLLREILTGGNNIIKGTGNFVKGTLNPVNFFKDFFKLRNLIGFPAAVAAVVYDTAMITDDMLRKRQPFDVAAGNEFLAGMLNLQPEIQEAKRLLADPKSNLSPAAKEYAQSLVDIGEYNNLLKLKQMPMKVAGMPGDPEDQEKLQKQLDILEKKINLASNTGAIDYQSEIDNKYDIDQAGTYVGESTSDKFLAPRYKREDLQIMPGESITEYTNRVKNNEKGNLIKVNKYGYGNTGLKDFLGDAPDKTGAPSFFSGQLKKSYGDLKQEPGKLPEYDINMIPAYVSQNYKTMKEDPLNKNEIKILTDYERGKLDTNYKGVLGPNQNLDEVFYDNVRFKKNNEGVSTLQKIKGLSPLGEYEDRKKWEQALYQPGMLGANQKFATGGIANTRIGFKTGTTIASLLKKFFKPKKTITIKRGESGTIGASGNSEKDFFNRYYFPPKGGFTNQSADARYFSKLGGPKGKPKVLTAEITPQELKEGYRLRSLDSKDPEIGDIIIPKSAKDKVKTDYYNTIRARIEKILKNND